MITTIIFDVGDTLIKEKEDDKIKLNHMKLELFPDVKSELILLRDQGYKLAILSNTNLSSSTDLIQALDKLGLKDFFIFTYATQSEGIYSDRIGKPDIDVFNFVLQQIKSKPFETIMVGNQLDTDIQGANDTGIHSIYINRDNKEKKEILNPKLNIFKVEMTSFENITLTIETIKKSLLLEKQAEDYRKDEFYDKSMVYFRRAANMSVKLKAWEKSEDLFVQAAISGERNELWRSIGFDWYQAALCIGENEPVDSSIYKDYDGSTHNYPTISIEKWRRFEKKDRISRAYKYSGYHGDDFLGPKDSYDIYKNAVDVYLENEDYINASETLVSASKAFVDQFGELPQMVVDIWESLSARWKNLDRLYSESEGKEGISAETLVLYLNLTEASLSGVSNNKQADMIYCWKNDIQKGIYLKKRKFPQFLFYLIWDLSSRYGIGLKRIVTLIIFSVGLVFPMLFWGLDRCCGISTTSKDGDFFEMVYFSVVTFATVGYGDILPVGYGRLIMCIEIVYSYLNIAILGSAIVRKLGR